MPSDRLTELQRRLRESLTTDEPECPDANDGAWVSIDGRPLRCSSCGALRSALMTS